MRTLIVGVGALGGVIAARLRAAGAEVWLATRTAEAAARLESTGLCVTGVGGAVRVGGAGVAPLDAYGPADPFDLVLLATKAGDAVAAAPRLPALLGPDGTLLPIQNGGVAQLLAERLRDPRVLGGLSNLGATMTAPGVYEQRNAGHLLVGELAGGESERARRVQRWLSRGVEVRVTPNVLGAVWSKLLINCSVTTVGALAGTTLRAYVSSPEGRALFDRTYEEALAVAKASGARPERMLVDPVPPPRPSAAYEAWLGGVVAGYGDAKPSMLQDFERRRPTEIDFINGWVAGVGRRAGVPTPVNLAIVELVQAITRGERAPGPENLRAVLQAAGSGPSPREERS
jgi:2-dehydropantoate 2-reductase